MSPCPSGTSFRMERHSSAHFCTSDSLSSVLPSTGRGPSVPQSQGQKLLFPCKSGGNQISSRALPLSIILVETAWITHINLASFGKQQKKAGLWCQSSLLCQEHPCWVCKLPWGLATPLCHWHFGETINHHWPVMVLGTASPRGGGEQCPLCRPTQTALSPALLLSRVDKLWIHPLLRKIKDSWPCLNSDP